MSSGKEKYSDIFHLPHHVSSKRPQMSRANRAAQFSPFAALVGYGDSINEAARATDQKAQLSDEESEAINQKLLYLQQHLAENPIVHILYFRPDKRKSGGAYVEFCGSIKQIDKGKGILLTDTGVEIPFKDISEMSGELSTDL